MSTASLQLEKEAGCTPVSPASPILGLNLHLSDSGQGRTWSPHGRPQTIACGRQLPALMAQHPSGFLQTASQTEERARSASAHILHKVALTPGRISQRRAMEA